MSENNSNALDTVAEPDEISTENVYYNTAWSNEAEGSTVESGKVIGTNAFSKFDISGTDPDKGWSNLLVLPENADTIVLTAGNGDSASYGMLRPTQDVLVKTEGEGYAVIDRFVNVLGNLTFDADAKIKVLNTNGLSGANNQADVKVTVNGEVYLCNGGQLYLWGMTDTPGQLLVNAGGKFITEGSGLENNGTITVKGYMELGSAGNAPKTSGVGQFLNSSTPNTNGHLIVDGVDGEGLLVAKHHHLNFGGGDRGTTNTEYGVDWWDAAEGSTVTILNGGKIETAAVTFRNGKNCILTVDNGSLIFNDGSAYGVDYSSMKSAYFDNYGSIVVTNGTVDMTGRKLDNAGSIVIAGSKFTADEISGTGSFTINAYVDGNGDAIRDAEGNLVATELNINALRQNIYANKNSGAEIALTGNISQLDSEHVLRVYGEATITDLQINAGYTGNLVSATGMFSIYGNTTITGNTVIFLNAFQTTASGVIEAGSVINTANFNAYDMGGAADGPEIDAVFVIKGELNTVSFIVTNSYYSPSSKDELIVAENGVISATTQSGHGRYSLQTGKMTVYGYATANLSAGGGTSNIGAGEWYPMILTIDGTYAAADNNNGKFIKTGDQNLDIEVSSQLNIVNNGTFRWSGGTLSNKGAISVTDGTFEATVYKDNSGAGSFTVNGEATLTLGSLTGTVTLADQAALSATTGITGGNISVMGEAAISAGGTYTNVAISVSGTLNITDIDLAAGYTVSDGSASNTAITLQDGANLVINDSNVIWNADKLTGSMLSGDTIYTVTGTVDSNGAYTKFTFAEDPGAEYKAIEGTFTVSQDTGSYSFTTAFAHTAGTGEGTVTYTLSSVSAGGKILVEGTDYEVSGTNFTLLSNNGPRELTVTISAEDQFGEAAGVDFTQTLMLVDYSAPEFAAEPGPDTTVYTPKVVFIAPEVADNFGVISSYSYTFNGETKEWNAGDTVTLTKNGTFSIKAVDEVGNELVRSFTVNNIDNILPEIAITAVPGKGNYTTGTVQVIATFSDEGVSGLVTREYAINGGSWKTYTGAITLDKNAEISFRAIDGAGNTTVESYNVDNISESQAESASGPVNYLVITPANDHVYHGEDVYMPEGQTYAVVYNTQGGKMDMEIGVLGKDGKGATDLIIGYNVAMEIQKEFQNPGNVNIGFNSSLKVEGNVKASGSFKSLVVGAASSIDVNGDVSGFAVMMTGYNSNLTAENLSGSSSSYDYLNVGYGADVNVADISGVENVIFGGNNQVKADGISGASTLMLGGGSSLDVSGDISGVKMLMVGYNSDLTAENLSGSSSSSYDYLNVGYGADIDVTGISGVENVIFGGNNQVSAGNVSGVTNLIFGYGTDAVCGDLSFEGAFSNMMLGGNNNVTLENISGLKNLYVGYNTEIVFDNGAADVDLSGVSGNWNFADILDMQGDLGVGAFEGSTYGNERDIFFSDGGVTFDFDSESTSLQYASMTNPTDWKVLEDGDTLAKGDYMIAAASLDAEDKSKASYAFNVTLA